VSIEVTIKARVLDVTKIILEVQKLRVKGSGVQDEVE